jgi:hypothetical protein
MRSGSYRKKGHEKKKQESAQGYSTQNKIDQLTFKLKGVGIKPASPKPAGDVKQEYQNEEYE